MVQPPMGFLDVQSHPLMFRRSQSREALEGLNQQQGVSTFQIHTKRNQNNGASSVSFEINPSVFREEYCLEFMFGK